MRNTLAIAIFAGGWVLGALVFPLREASADKTVTYLTANSTVDSMSFTFPDASTVIGVVCGHTTDSLSAVQPATCTSAIVLPAGALKTNVQSLRTGAALTAWKNDQGL